LNGQAAALDPCCAKASHEPALPILQLQSPSHPVPGWGRWQTPWPRPLPGSTASSPIRLRELIGRLTSAGRGKLELSSARDGRRRGGGTGGRPWSDLDWPRNATPATGRCRHCSHRPGVAGACATASRPCWPSLEQRAQPGLAENRDWRTTRQQEAVGSAARVA